MAKVDKNKKETKKKKTFMKDFKAELKRVTWLTPKQLVNNTTAVIVIVLATAAIVFALDFTFKAINTYGINKLQTIVGDNNADETEAETTNSEQTESTNTSEETSEEQAVEDATEETSQNEEQSAE